MLEWNEKTSRSVTEKMEKLRKETEDVGVDVNSIANALKELHPEISMETLCRDMQEIQEGIEQIYQAETDQMNESAAELLSRQLQGKTTEEQKGELCQLFDSIKLSDEAVDSDIEKAKVDSRDLAQMPLEELRGIVAEQLVNSISGCMHHAMEGSLENFAGMDDVSLKTGEDALLLAAAQYSEAQLGEIPFEYTEVPRLLGQCAAAQARIAAYCEEIITEDLPEETKRDKIFEFIQNLFMFLIVMALSFLVGTAVGSLASAAMGAVSALLGTGIVALVLELVLIVPVMWLSFAAVLGAGFLIYEAVKGVCALFRAAVPKVKQLYGKLVVWLGGENPFGEEDLLDEEFEEESDYMYADNIVEGEEAFA